MKVLPLTIVNKFIVIKLENYAWGWQCIHEWIVLIVAFRVVAKVNKMSSTIYEALKLLKTLSLNYDSIHACTYNIKF